MLCTSLTTSLSCCPASPSPRHPLALTSKDLQLLTDESPEVRESLLHTVSLRLKQNLLAIPIFAQMKETLEQKKYFKLLGAFDLLSTLFELESVKAKELIFNEGDAGDKFYVVCEVRKRQ